MENSCAVCVADAKQRLPEKRNRFDFWNGASAADHLREGLAVHELHYHDGGALMDHEGVESGEVGMVQVGLGSCFRPEALDQFGVLGEIRVQDLHRHHAVEARVDSLVDHTHAALAELLQNPVAGDLCADHGVLLNSLRLSSLLLLWPLPLRCAQLES